MVWEPDVSHPAAIASSGLRSMTQNTNRPPLNLARRAASTEISGADVIATITSNDPSVSNRSEPTQGNSQSRWLDPTVQKYQFWLSEPTQGNSQKSMARRQRLAGWLAQVCRRDSYYVNAFPFLTIGETPARIIVTTRCRYNGYIMAYMRQTHG